jgi:hypothetical protein
VGPTHARQAPAGCLTCEKRDELLNPKVSPLMIMTMMIMTIAFDELVTSQC